MFKTRLIYIKLKRNNVEVVDLKTNETVRRHAIQPFSSSGNVVSDFNLASETIQSALQELGLQKEFLPLRLKILIQQLEGTKGKLSDIEKKVLNDLSEICGANKVVILEQAQPVSTEAALSYLAEN